MGLLSIFKTLSRAGKAAERVEPAIEGAAKQAVEVVETAAKTEAAAGKAATQIQEISEASRQAGENVIKNLSEIPAARLDGGKKQADLLLKLKTTAQENGLIDPLIRSSGSPLSAKSALKAIEKGESISPKEWERVEALIKRGAERADKLNLTNNINGAVSALHPSRIKDAGDLETKIQALRKTLTDENLIQTRGRLLPERSAEKAILSIEKGQPISPRELARIEKKFGEDYLSVSRGISQTAEGADVAAKATKAGSSLRSSLAVAGTALTIGTIVWGDDVHSFFTQNKNATGTPANLTPEMVVRQKMGDALMEIGGASTTQLNCLGDVYAASFDKSARNKNNKSPNDVLSEFKQEVQDAITATPECRKPKDGEAPVSEQQLDAMYSGVVTAARYIDFGKR